MDDPDQDTRAYDEVDEVGPSAHRRGITGSGVAWFW
jgi:hypothetical protein